MPNGDGRENTPKDRLKESASDFSLDTEVNPSTVLGTGPIRAAKSETQEVACGFEKTALSDFQPMVTKFDEDRSLEGSAQRSVKHYEIIRELGRGGMGRVLLARDTRLGRRVALKFLMSKNAEFTRRFLIEAQTTAQLNHENIVVLHEADEFKNTPYMVLEYLEGESLGDYIASRSLSATRIVELMIPVVRALVRAHKSGIVHRDLKPENIFITDAGVVKVLDFGIAKLFASQEQDLAELGKNRAGHGPGDGESRDMGMTANGAIIGTMPYMSPEQWGQGTVDHKTDLWAVGIILFEMLSGEHPLAPVTSHRLMAAATLIQNPMPSIAKMVPGLPGGLVELVDGCLKKRQEERVHSAQALLEALEALVPGRSSRFLREGESPFPGLSAFQETDSDRFFGRSADVLRAIKLLRERPLLGIVGPSGVGKSSFARAGLVPALRASGEAWEPLIIRPGKDPILGLAKLLESRGGEEGDGDEDVSDPTAVLEESKTRIREEPGYFGTKLRDLARSKTEHILVFVDQFEELYTLTADIDERMAFTSALLGAADDPASPLRVAVSIRSDFLDRVGESKAFVDELTGGLLFLRALGREGLREALVAPVEAADYRYESPEIVRDMLESLETSDGALPLLQFAAAKLWEARDRSRKLLTTNSYEAMGGVEGTLASHADEVLDGLSTAQLSLTRAIFQRLVTPMRTRDIADLDELDQLSTTPGEVESLVDRLVQSRLLVVQRQSETESPAIEIVHESLLRQWPTLRQWLDEEHEDTAFLQQLRTSARQWDNSDRPVGLIWRGETMLEARRFAKRFRGTLAEREREYLDAVMKLANRSTRIKRFAIVGSFAFLSLLVVVGAVVLFTIREAEREAVEQTATAEKALVEIQKKNAVIVQKDAEREKARVEAEKMGVKATAAEKEAADGRETIAMTEEQRQEALRDARAQRDLAEAQRKKAEQAQARAEAQTAVAVSARAVAVSAQADAERERAKTKALLDEKKKELEKLQKAGLMIKEDLD